MRVYQGVIERNYEPIPKPGRIHDSNAINAARLPWCEYCGSNTGDKAHVHHIRSRGAGGDDIARNLVSLCWVCHFKIHEGRIRREEVIAFQTARETLRKLLGDAMICPGCGGRRWVWHRKEGVLRCYNDRCGRTLAA